MSNILNLSSFLYSSKLKSSSTYSLESTINTDANGKYTISSTKDATVYDFQIEISSLTISSYDALEVKFGFVA